MTLTPPKFDQKQMHKVSWTSSSNYEKKKSNLYIKFTKKKDRKLKQSNLYKYMNHANKMAGLIFASLLLTETV